jgi:hypothetical protein
MQVVKQVQGLPALSSSSADSVLMQGGAAALCQGAMYRWSSTTAVCCLSCSRLKSTPCCLCCVMSSLLLHVR